LTINKLVTILVPSMTNTAHQNAAAPGQLASADLRCDRQEIGFLGDGLVLVHLPVHASWFNQSEILFSIVQCRVLEPNDFANLPELARTLNIFERHSNEIAEPFEWNFTRDDLATQLDRLAAHEH